MAIEALPIGQHALIDINGADGLDDPRFLEQVMRRAAGVAGARIVDAKMHSFGEGQGITGVLLLAESHISVHTWPEYGFAAFDIFMCGSAMVSEAIDTIARAFPGVELSIRTIPRGSDRPGRVAMKDYGRRVS